MAFMNSDTDTSTSTKCKSLYIEACLWSNQCRVHRSKEPFQIITIWMGLIFLWHTPNIYCTIWNLDWKICLPGALGVLFLSDSTAQSDRRHSYLFHIEWQSLFHIEYYMIYLCFKEMDEASQLNIEKQFHLATHFMLELRISNTLLLF